MLHMAPAKRRAHAGTAVPQAPEALTGSPELPSLGDRGTLGREGWGGLGLAGSQRPRLAALRYSINRSRSVLIMIIETDGLPMHSVRCLAVARTMAVLAAPAAPSGLG